VGDERGGGVEDALGGAVVLLQAQHARAREVVLEVQDVLDVGAPPGVDRLVLVADDGHVASRSHQVPDQLVLRAVRVLVLVDEDVLEAPAVGFADLLVAPQHLHRAQEEIVEVERVRRAQGLVIAGGHPGQGLGGHGIAVGVIRIAPEFLRAEIRERSRRGGFTFSGRSRAFRASRTACSWSSSS
jgi:hypothetical protein